MDREESIIPLNRDGSADMIFPGKPVIHIHVKDICTEEIRKLISGKFWRNFRFNMGLCTRCWDAPLPWM